VFHIDVAKIDRDVAHIVMVVYVYCKRLFQMFYLFFFRRMLQVCLFGCHICFTHMLQEYVRNVLAVSVLCCNKYFHVANCKFFMWMLRMFHTLCCKCMFQIFYLRQTYVAFKCFVFQRYVQIVMEHGPGAWGRGAASRWPANGARSALGSWGTGRACPRPGSRVPSRGERERRGSEERSGQRRAERDR
jgi:hypothetical protein